MGYHGVPCVQTFQEHVLSYLCALHRANSVSNQARQLLNPSWTEKARGKVESLDGDQMLVQ